MLSDEVEEKPWHHRGRGRLTSEKIASLRKGIGVTTNIDGDVIAKILSAAQWLAAAIEGKTTSGEGRRALRVTKDTCPQKKERREIL